MTIRQEIEARERAALSSWATLAEKSAGRERPEEADTVRTCFMVDRDRIIHSKSFRRLKHKTQVFIAPPGDHYRTRLTHTLEVGQIARTIGAGLNLNLDLIEAMSLGHDVGHTPFAHSGEQILDQLLPQGFRHNENSIRVLTRIEQHRNGSGLNLSQEVLEGIMRHSGYSSNEADSATLEGQVIRLSDKIAYVQHDIDDSMRAGLLALDEIPQGYLEILGDTHSKRIATLVKDTIAFTRSLMAEGRQVRVQPSPEIDQALRGLRSFMFEKIYNGPVCQAERSRAMFIIEHLFNYYCKKPEKMSPLYQEIADAEGKERAAADYISGMSDAYCVSLFNDIFVPHSLVPGANKT